jgi:hypothetical protein
VLQRRTLILSVSKLETFCCPFLTLPFFPLPCQVWGLERGFCLRTLMCHSSCNALDITSDGSMIASGMP